MATLIRTKRSTFATFTFDQGVIIKEYQGFLGFDQIRSIAKHQSQNIVRIRVGYKNWKTGSNHVVVLKL